MKRQQCTRATLVQMTRCQGVANASPQAPQGRNGLFGSNSRK
jgi:hypothetical protein